MNKKRPPSEFTHIKDLITKIIDHCRVSENTELNEIRKIWKHCVGNTVADHAMPAFICNGSLTVFAKSPTLMQQLRYQSKDIIRQMNYALGENRISEIKFKIK